MTYNNDIYHYRSNVNLNDISRSAPKILIFAWSNRHILDPNISQHILLRRGAQNGTTFQAICGHVHLTATVALFSTTAASSRCEKIPRKNGISGWMLGIMRTSEMKHADWTVENGIYIEPTIKLWGYSWVYPKRPPSVGTMKQGNPLEMDSDHPHSIAGIELRLSSRLGHPIRNQPILTGWPSKLGNLWNLRTLCKNN